MEMKPKIMLNFEQYDLPKPTVIRMDCVNTNLRQVEVFDAIICDPPYGFRAMTRTAGKNDKKKNNRKDRKSTNATTQEDEDVSEESGSLPKGVLIEHNSAILDVLHQIKTPKEEKEEEHEEEEVTNQVREEEMTNQVREEEMTNQVQEEQSELQ